MVKFKLPIKGETLVTSLGLVLFALPFSINSFAQKVVISTRVTAVGGFLIVLGTLWMVVKRFKK